MRVARERLIFHALCVLAEAQDRAKAGEPQSRASLRLALALLHLHGAQKGWIDQFWHSAVRLDAVHGVPGIGRRQALTAAFNALARQVGMEHDFALGEAIRQARAAK